MRVFYVGGGGGGDCKILLKILGSTAQNLVAARALRPHKLKSKFIALFGSTDLFRFTLRILLPFGRPAGRSVGIIERRASLTPS